MLTSALFATCLVCFTLVASAPVDDVDHESYLRQFGYISGSESFVSDEGLTTALLDFQDMAGIEQTGLLDEATRMYMKMPRCGQHDVEMTPLMDKVKRYVLLGTKWHHRTLTYKITKFSRKVTNGQVSSSVTQAFAYWARATNLSFRRVGARSKADINIRFEIRNHGDGSPFDGPFGVLAHAYRPENGRAHFDDQEHWAIGPCKKREINLRQVMTHEFGHLLGLGHSRKRAAVMAPFYKGYERNFRLDIDDIRGIQRR